MGCCLMPRLSRRGISLVFGFLILLCLTVISLELRLSIPLMSGMNNGSLAERNGHQRTVLSADVSYSLRPMPSKLFAEENVKYSQNCTGYHRYLAQEPNCSNCFRPKLQHIQSLIRKVEFETEILPGQPPDFYKAKPNIIQELVDDYLVMPSASFTEKCPYLLVLQPSLMEDKPGRDAVRRTWASVAKEQKWPGRRVNAKVKIIYVMAPKAGFVNETRGLQPFNATRFPKEDPRQEMLSESKQHDDILVLNMLESYENLTLKMLSAMKWVKTYCPCSRFILKVDQDTFVNIPLLVDTLLASEKRLNFAILGMAYTDISLVMRSGRWGVSPSLYPMSKYPVYASGCGYIISTKAAFQMVDAVPFLPMFNIEDAFITGVMRRVIACDIFTLDNVFTHKIERGPWTCKMVKDEKILGTNLDSAGHRELWNLFVNNGEGC